MRINLYVQNHISQIGIEDFYEILKDIFISRGIEFEKTDRLDPDATNIVIEEFSSSYEIHYLQDFKRSHPKSKLIIVLTEFFSDQKLSYSFNVFSRLLVPSYLLCCRPLILFKRKDLPAARVHEYACASLLALIWIPLIFVGKLISLFGRLPLASVLKRLVDEMQHKLSVAAYMQTRFIGFEQIFSFADGFLLAHEGIRPGLEKFLCTRKTKIQFSELFLPEMLKFDEDKFLLNKKVGFEITGTITRYRKQQLNKVTKMARDHSLLELTRHFVKSFNPKIGKNENRPAFSLHPPQTSRWSFSSPTRIYRAVIKDRNVPVVTKIFSDHPIENICIEYDGLETLHQLLSIHREKQSRDQYIASKILPYQQKAQLENSKWIEKLEMLDKL